MNQRTKSFHDRMGRIIDEAAASLPVSDFAELLTEASIEVEARLAGAETELRRSVLRVVDGGLEGPLSGRRPRPGVSGPEDR